MATIAEQLTSLANTKTAIKNAIVAKGVSVADTDTFASYADKIGQISGGGGEVVNKTKFGATIDTFFGDVDANGVLQTPTWSGVLVFSGVKTVDAYCLYYAFYRRTGIISVDMSSLQTVNNYGLYNTFANSTGIISVDMSSLQTVNNFGLQNAFSGCAGITSVNLSSLQTVKTFGLSNTFINCTGIISVNLTSLKSVGDSGMQNAFQRCTNLTSVDLSSLQTVTSRGLQAAFSNCNALTSMSFPSLTSVAADAFGGASASTQMFYQCTGLIEIHFRADAQAAIEATNGYANKWGATNATIYFDL